MKNTVVMLLLFFGGALVFAAGQKGGGGANPPITHPKYGELAYTEIDWYMHEGQLQPDFQMVWDAMNEYLKPIINAKVNYHGILASEWATRAPVMLASGGNEGIYGYFGLNYSLMAAQGVFYALDELLDKYGPSVKASLNSRIWDGMRVNGKIYGIGILKDNAYIFPFIYNDTMAKRLGIDMTKWPRTSQYYKLEPYFNEVMEKRNQVYGNLEESLIGWFGNEILTSQRVDSLFGLWNGIAVVNYPDFMDVKGYPPEKFFSIYGTQEYRDYCKAVFRMVQKNIIAYDYTGKDDWTYNGNTFGGPSWGYVYIPENLNGDKYVTKLIEPDSYWMDTAMFTSAGTAFSANIPNPERAMMFFDVNINDSHLATMLRFGIEGVHHTIDSAGKMAFTPANSDPNARRYMQWYGGGLGNLFLSNAPEEIAGPDNFTQKRLKELNDAAAMSLYFGFNLDSAPIANELAACTNVIQEYNPTLVKGWANSEAEVDTLIDEFNVKLKANGLDKILAEVQRQADAFLANKK
jgi:putative aldouronate transport system substrate-binding protein